MKILNLGDSALTVEFGDRIDPALQAQVQGLDLALQAARQCGQIDGVVETIPTFRSLTVIFDPLITRAESLASDLSRLASEPANATTTQPRTWYLPACYEGEFAPDLIEVATHAGIETSEVINLHARTQYVVYMLGFLPGFPFMGDLPEQLRLPRRTEPRVRVPAGSVAIATGLTAIYPWESPGGWHLIGRCPVPLFDPKQATPALLQPGDRVSFHPVDTDEYEGVVDALRRDAVDPTQWLQGSHTGHKWGRERGHASS